MRAGKTRQLTVVFDLFRDVGSKAKPSITSRSKPMPWVASLAASRTSSGPNGAMLGADADCHALYLPVFLVFTAGLQVGSRVGFQAGERQPFIFTGVLHA